MALVTETLINATTGLPYVAVYKNIPFWLNWWFAIAVLLFLCVLVIAGYAWFRISLRNRTNVIMHMPNKTRKVYSYKNYVGDSFALDGVERDGNGNPIKSNYMFDPECLETGYFGKYIEYDYGIIIPRGSKKYSIGDELKNVFKIVSAMLNSDLAVDLLLAQKFKEFVKMMLIIIMIGVVIGIIASAIPLFYHPIQQCTIVGNNQTINVIQEAVKRALQ